MAMDATSLLSSQLGAAAGCAYFLNLLQKSPRLGWITDHTDTVNRIVRAVLALAVTVGISWAWAPSVGGSHILTIDIPSVPDLAHGAWHWFCQYSFTHVVGSALDKNQPAAA